jgi:SAM-dependent methyltransferase
MRICNVVWSKVTGTAIDRESLPPVLQPGYRYPIFPVLVWAASGAFGAVKALEWFMGAMPSWPACGAAAALGTCFAVQRLLGWRAWLRDLMAEGHRLVEMELLSATIDRYVGVPVGEQRLLDLGAGSGTATRHILNQHKVQSIRAIDLDACPPHVEKYDGKTIPFPDDSFDLCIALYIFHHIEEQTAMLAQCRRVAKRILIFEDLVNETEQPLLARTFFGSHFWAYRQSFHTHLDRSRDQWRVALKRAGFVVEEEFDVPASRAIPYRRVGFLAARR